MGQQEGERVLGGELAQELPASDGEQHDGGFGEVHPSEIREEALGARRA